MMRGGMNERKMFSLTLAIGFGVVLLVGFMLLLTDTARGDSKLEAPLTPPVVISQEGPDMVFAGGTITYTVWVSNVSGSTVEGMVLYDTWTTSLFQDLSVWWERGVLAQFNGYVAYPPSAVVSVTHELLPALKRGEARFAMAPLAAGESVQVIFSVTAPITVQPALAEHEPFRRIMGPTSLENSIIAEVPNQPAAEAQLVSSMVVGPVLRLEKFAVGEVAGENVCRVGRLVTYTVAVQNLQIDGTRVRSDAYPATDLVVSERVPAIVSTAFVTGTASVPGVTVEHNAGLIEWTFPPEYALSPGQTMYLTFTLRVPRDHPYGARDNIKNLRRDLLAQAEGMPHHPASALRDLSVKVLGPFDKVVETAPLPQAVDETFSNRVITYTLTFYNPYHDQAFSDVMIEDALPMSFSYIQVITGTDPDVIREDNRILEWRNQAVSANGEFQVIYTAFVPPQTVPNACMPRNHVYASELLGTSASAPFEYVGNNDNKMGIVEVIGAVLLHKTASPSNQMPGELVMYTVSVENQSDREVPASILTDTLPMTNETMYFSFLEMVGNTPPYDPNVVISNVVRWDNVPLLASGETLEFAFNAVVDGRAEVRYPNELTAYNRDAAICPLSSKAISRQAPVTVKSPIMMNKESLISPVVQGELARYKVTLYNNSPSTAYDIFNVIDNLSSVRFTNPVDGEPYYVYTATPPIHLESGKDWEHPFDVIATGEGLGSGWCEARADSNKDLLQLEGSVVVVFDDPPVMGANAQKLAPMTVIPHISLLQEAYPNPVAIGSTTVVTLLLQDNRAAPTPTTGIRLSWTNPQGVFSVTESVPLYDSVVNDVYYWDDITVDGQAMVTMSLLMPDTVGNVREFRNYSTPAKVVDMDDPEICIPSVKHSLKVRRGIEIRKEPNLDIVSPYNEVIYTLQAHNLTGDPVAGVVLTDVLPPGWEFVEWISGPEPDAEDPLIWHLDTIPAEGFIEMKFKARSYILLGYQINEVVGVAPINLGYSDKYTDNVGVMVISGIGLFKDVNVDEVAIGETVIYTLTLYNGTNVKLKDIVVVDTLPLGFSFVESLAGPGVPVVETVGDHETLTWNVSQELDKAKSMIFVFSAEVVDEDLPSGPYYNEAAGEAYNSDTGEAREVPATGQAARVWVAGAPTVQADKTVAPSTVYAGKEVTYTITLYNEMAQAVSLVVTDTLPAEFEFVAGIDPSVTEVVPGTQPRVVWRELSLAAGETLTLTFRARPQWTAETGSYCNQIQVQANASVLPPLLSIACVNVMALPGVDAQISKDDGIEVAQAGDTFNYTLIYTNAEESEMTLYDVVITETLTLFEYVVSAGAGWVDLGNGQYRYEVGELAPGESGQVNFAVTLVTDTIPVEVLSFRNEAEIGYTTDELSVEIDPSNNVAVDVNIFRALFKTVSPPAVNAGWDVVYTITLHNDMAQVWHDVQIVDALPEGFTFKQMLVGPAPDEDSAPHRPTWSLAEVPGEEVLTLAFWATVGLEVPTGEYASEVTAVASRGGTQFDVPPTGPTASVAVRGAPAVQINKVATPLSLNAGEEVTYTITLVSAEAAALPVVLTDVLPSYFHFVAPITPSTFTHIPGAREQVVWSGLSLEPGGTVEVAFRAEVDSAARTANYCNGVQALVGDFLYPVMDKACVNIQGLYSPVDLHVTHSDGQRAVIPLDVITYTIHYTNSEDSSPLYNGVITETMTPPTALLGLNPGWTQVREGVYTYSLGTIELDTKGTVLLVGQVNPEMSPQVLTMSSHIEVGFTTLKDPLVIHPEHGSDTDVNTIRHGPDLKVRGVRFHPTVPGADSPLQVFVTIQNQGTLPTQRWDVSDDWWHYVASVYLLEPNAPPPDGIFDHDGELCWVWGGVLQAGQTLEIACSETPIAPAIGDYALYVQADVTWDAAAPWGQWFGLVEETREDNNFYDGGVVTVAEFAGYSNTIYLPLVLRAR